MKQPQLYRYDNNKKLMWLAGETMDNPPATRPSSAGFWEYFAGVWSEATDKTMDAWREMKDPFGGFQTITMQAHLPGIVVSIRVEADEMGAPPNDETVIALIRKAVAQDDLVIRPPMPQGVLQVAPTKARACSKPVPVTEGGPRVLRAFPMGGTITTKYLMAKTGLDHSAVIIALRHLRKEDEVVQIGRGSRTRYYLNNGQHHDDGLWRMPCDPSKLRHLVQLVNEHAPISYVDLAAEMQMKPGSLSRYSIEAQAKGLIELSHKEGGTCFYRPFPATK